MLRTKMKTILSKNGALRYSLLRAFDSVFGRFGKGNRHLETQLIRSLVRNKYNFLISYVPLLFVRVLVRVFPRLGTVCFAIHNKHSDRLYSCWGAFNVGLKVWIFDVLSKGEDVDLDFYRICVDAIHSPALLVEFLSRFDFLNKNQQQILLDRIKVIILKLNLKNQDLFCKQLLHLLSKNQIRTDITLVVAEVIDSCGPGFSCRSYSEFSDVFLASKTQHSKVVIQNSAFFETDGHMLFLQQVEPTQDENFFKSNIFMSKSRSVFYYFFRNQFEKLKCKKIDEATLLAVRPDLSKFQILYAVFRSALNANDFDFKKSDILFVDGQFDSQLITFFEEFFGCVILKLDEVQYSVERLNLLGIESHQVFSPDEPYTDLINLITKKIDLNPERFQEQTVILTNSFVVSDDALSALSDLAKGAEVIYLDIEIASLREILGAFLYAETIVCGDHNILSLNCLRKASLPTIVVNQSQGYLSKVLSGSLAPNINEVDLQHLTSEYLLKVKKSVVSCE